MTRSLMHLGSFLLHDAIKVCLKDGTRLQIREAAAKALRQEPKNLHQGRSHCLQISSHRALCHCLKENY
ncbi:hypothetical protein N9A78_03490 [Akkermansiaceae bacterium]|nr:hypothetical protein [Akkermansiaceae bacterium]